MSRIELRGVIVPSEYDNDWLESYIEKGLFTPESRFRDRLVDASKDEPLTVYVNSPGGSVFAAYEMINALHAWKASTKQPVTVEIGAMAASAASALAVMAADEIKVYKNSKAMFHGATTITWAGSGAHADQADLLDKINDDIKTALLGRTTLDEDAVDVWFDEGRAGWLTSDEMLNIGLANDVLGGDAQVIEFSNEELEEIAAQGLQVAALFDSITDEDVTSSITVELEEDDERDDDGSEDSIDDEQVSEVDDSISERVDPAWDEGFAAGASSRDDEVSEAKADRLEAIEMRDAALETCKELGGSLTSTTDTLKETTEALEKTMESREEWRKRAEAAEEKLSKLTGGMRATPDQSDSDCSWQEALAKCNGDYAKARQKYPLAYAAQRSLDRKKR